MVVGYIAVRFRDDVEESSGDLRTEGVGGETQTDPTPSYPTTSPYARPSQFATIPILFSRCGAVEFPERR